MNFLKNLKVGKKIGLLIATSAIGFISLFGISTYMSSKVFESANFCNVNVLPSVKIIANAGVNYNRLRANVYRYILNTDESKRHEISSLIEQQIGTIEKDFQEYRKYLADDKDKELLNKESALFHTYIKATKSVMSLAEQNKPEEALKVANSNMTTSLHLNDTLQEHVDYNFVLAENSASEASLFSNESFFIQLGIVTVLLIILFMLGSIITKLITESLNKVKEGLFSFFRFLSLETSSTKHIEIENKDEFGEMANEINHNIDHTFKIINQDQIAINDITRVTKMMNAGFVSVRVREQAGSTTLQAVVSNFNNALEEIEKALAEVSSVMSQFGNSDFSANFELGKYSGEIGGILTSLKGLSESMGDFMALLSLNGLALNHGATTLSQASGNLSESSNTQASSLEETAAAIEELTSNISANSQKASQMASLAQETQTAADDGRKLANSTVTAMNEIQAATQAINNAVDVIDNIAFQTNILSLNAAVEAASAGDAGKGFAVVAQEVRNLAGRSAEAARQIKELSELANSKSNGGIHVSHNMMKGFDVINEKISLTTQLVQDVANGSREQMAGINQINTAVAQLDQMTQQNAQSANQVNAMSEEILTMSQTLSDTASRTKYRPDSESRVCQIDMMFETNKLKFDHINFKNNNFGKIKDSVSVWTVTNETQCDLGKWIETHSSESYANTPEWNSLLKNHAHVHQKVQEYINREKTGASPEELCRISKEIEQDTAQVFGGLNQLRTTACMQEVSE